MNQSSNSRLSDRQKGEEAAPGLYLEEDKVESFRRFLAEIPGGAAVIESGTGRRVVDSNEEMFRSAGYTREDMIKLSEGFNGIFSAQDQSILNVAESEAVRKGSTGEYEVRMRTKKGEQCWFVFRLHYWGEREGRKYFLVSAWDVNERKQMEEELHVQTERYRLVEQITGEMPFDYDVESKEMLISKKYITMRGMDRVLEHFAKEKEQKEIIHPEDYEIFQTAMQKASDMEKMEALELRLNISCRPQPQYAWYRINYKSIPDIDGKIIRILGRIIDISQEKREHSRLTEQIRRDGLTGMLNKAATKNEIQRFLKKDPEGCHAMFLIDIDNFKSVNDTFGHLFGDAVLINVAEKIMNLFRITDITGRVGGDEYLVLMKNVTHEQATERAGQICREMEQKYSGEETEVKISCSVGISLFDRDGRDYETLFGKADIAMYHAKEEGKNRFRMAEPGSKIEGFRYLPRAERTANYGLVKMQDENFLSAAFALMSHARDLNSSMNILMERIGRRYRLGIVAVMVDNPADYELVMTNCWRVDKGIVEQPAHVDKYKHWEGYRNGFDDRGILCMDDCAKEAVSESDRELFRERGIYAMINCRFSYREVKGGIITFIDRNKPRVWSDFEKETFLEISRLIAVFVSLKSQQDEDKKAISQLKRRDPLTGLYNEEAFKEKAKGILSHMEKQKAYAIVFNDINDFSYVNENFGHDAGNRILKEYAKVISAAPQVISCRLYSDLFISLLVGKSRESIQDYVEESAKGFMMRQRELYPQSNMSVSTGIYFVDRPDEDIETAIENANLTRKSIKKSSLTTVCKVYDKELRQQRELEKRIAADFTEALKKEQFLVYIQPKFLLQDMTLTGAEALVRWKHEDGRLEPPNVFIPVLEKYGYIVELDFYVFEHILAYMKRWKEEGKDFKRISINFSRRHFEGQGIYKRVCELTKQYGIGHEAVEIEITEGLLVSGLETVKTEMEQLRSDGFSVAIDDFGTGYSSLSMLRDIPADIVKIDKSFLQRRNFTEEFDFIVKMGALIRSVKEEVIFEGIETEEQLRFLVKCGFQYGQGFLYAAPMPVEVFEEKYMK